MRWSYLKILQAGEGGGTLPALLVVLQYYGQQGLDDTAALRFTLSLRTDCLLRPYHATGTACSTDWWTG